MITVQVNLVSGLGDGNRLSKYIHTARTLETAREYFKGRCIIGEIYDEIQQKHVEMIFIVESVELAQEG